MSSQDDKGLIRLATHRSMVSWLFFIALAAAVTKASVLQKRAPICYGGQFEHTGSIQPMDCIMAARSMPTTSVEARFGVHAPDGSASKLPRHFASGRCMVGVSMAMSIANGDDWSSWSDITRAAYDVITECASRHRLIRRGGMDRVGKANQIIVDIFPYQEHLKFLIDMNDPRTMSSNLGDGAKNMHSAAWKTRWSESEVPSTVE